MFRTPWRRIETDRLAQPEEVEHALALRALLQCAPFVRRARTLPLLRITGLECVVDHLDHQHRNNVDTAQRPEARLTEDDQAAGFACSKR